MLFGSGMPEVRCISTIIVFQRFEYQRDTPHALDQLKIDHGSDKPRFSQIAGNDFRRKLVRRLPFLDKEVNFTYVAIVPISPPVVSKTLLLMPPVIPADRSKSIIKVSELPPPLNLLILWQPIVKVRQQRQNIMFV